jgi:hypothetical protein
MPMLAISLGSHLAALPTEWGSVTLAQSAALSALPEGATIQDCLAVLLECSGAELLHLAPKQMQKALASVLFLSEPIPARETWQRPAALFLGETEVPVLDTLEDLSFGQAADIGALIREHAQDLAQLRLKVLATILQPAYDGTAYDTDRVPVVEVLCGAVKLREALPLTDFFLPITTGYDAPTPPTSSASLSPALSAPPT